MAVISRALIKTGRAAKRAQDKKEEEAQKDAIRQMILLYPEVLLDLKHNLEVVQNTDLSLPENAFLIVHKLEQGLVLGKAEPGNKIPNINFSILEQFKWISTDLFDFTAYPVTEKYVGTGIAIRFLIWSKTSITSPVSLHMYAITNEESLFPEASICDTILDPATLLVVDTFISGDVKEDEQNFFTAVFSYIDSTANSYLLKIRVKADFDIDTTKFGDYEEIKGSQFLNTTKQKHIHPWSVKSIVKKQVLGANEFSIKSGINTMLIWGSAALFLGGLLVPMYLFADLGFFFWILLVVYLFFVLFFLFGVFTGITEINTVKKAKKLKILDKKMKNTEHFQPVDKIWIIDFCEISEWWSYNPNLDPSTIEAYSYKTK